MLVLTIVGALLATLGATVADFDTAAGKALGVAGAIALAVAPIVGSRSAGPKSVHKRLRVRSVSESLKTEIYQYLTGSGRYADDAKADGALAARRKELVGKVKELATYPSRVTPEPKEVPAVHDDPSYIQERIQTQIDWYRGRSSDLAGTLAWLRRAEYALTLGAAAIAAAAAFPEVDGLALWVPVVTTAAAAVAAHIAGGRYELVVLGYFATAGKLADLVEQRDRRGHPCAARPRCLRRRVRGRDRLREPAVGRGLARRAVSQRENRTGGSGAGSCPRVWMRRSGRFGGAATGLPGQRSLLAADVQPGLAKESFRVNRR